MELVIIRHAEPVRVAPGEVDGPVDPPLTERGRDQAGRLAAWLHDEPFDEVVTSPLRRAVETAEPLAARLDIEPVVDESMSEYDHRADHYIPVEELRTTQDDRWTAMIEGRWEEFGGEHPDVFRGRVVPALEAIVDRHPGGRVAVIAHGGIVNVYTAHVLGIDRLLWFEPAYTSVTRLAAARTGERSLLSLNETGHLRGKREGAGTR
jgi:2,3-bisphosphoglycerate-dependent phosphoglycerate mutase